MTQCRRLGCRIILRSAVSKMLLHILIISDSVQESYKFVLNTSPTPHPLFPSCWSLRRPEAVDQDGSERSRDRRSPSPTPTATFSLISLSLMGNSDTCISLYHHPSHFDKPSRTDLGHLGWNSQGGTQEKDISHEAPPSAISWKGIERCDRGQYLPWMWPAEAGPLIMSILC